MNTNRLALALLLLSSSLPLRAQKTKTPPALPPQAIPSKGTAPAAPVKKPKPKCVCDQPGFKALTDKARAVEAYWDARREYNIAGVLVGSFGLLALLSGDSKAMHEAAAALTKSRDALDAARRKAVGLEGIKVPGNDDALVEVTLKPDVDYTLKP